MVGAAAVSDELCHVVPADSRCEPGEERRAREWRGTGGRAGARALQQQQPVRQEAQQLQPLQRGGAAPQRL